MSVGTRQHRARLLLVRFRPRASLLLFLSLSFRGFLAYNPEENTVEMLGILEALK